LEPADPVSPPTPLPAGPPVAAVPLLADDPVCPPAPTSVFAASGSDFEQPIANATQAMPTADEWASFDRRLRLIAVYCRVMTKAVVALVSLLGSRPCRCNLAAEVKTGEARFLPRLMSFRASCDHPLRGHVPLT